LWRPAGLRNCCRATDFPLESRHPKAANRENQGCGYRGEQKRPPHFAGMYGGGGKKDWA